MNQSKVLIKVECFGVFQAKPKRNRKDEVTGKGKSAERDTEIKRSKVK
jgi:hypothetical protein